MPGECLPLSARVIESDTAATGLALLPLLGAGHIHTVKSRHQEAVRRGTRMAGRAPAGRRRPVHRPARHGVSCTATRSPRWRCARLTASRGTPACKQPAAACHPVHRATPRIPRRRRLAVFPRPVRRYVGLRLAHLRPAERPSRGDHGPPASPEGCSRYLDHGRGRSPSHSPTPISPGRLTASTP